MSTARFEIDCENPEIVRDSVQIDDSTEVKYMVENGKLVFEIEAESVKTLMKIAYSACNRIQLSIDTIKKFGKK